MKALEVQGFKLRYPPKNPAQRVLLIRWFQSTMNVSIPTTKILGVAQWKSNSAKLFQAELRNALSNVKAYQTRKLYNLSIPQYKHTTRSCVEFCYRMMIRWTNVASSSPQDGDFAKAVGCVRSMDEERLGLSDSVTSNRKSTCSIEYCYVMQSIQ